MRMSKNKHITKWPTKIGDTYRRIKQYMPKGILCIICHEDPVAHTFEVYTHPHLPNNLALLEWKLQQKEDSND